jgi:hypothetical protein
LVGEVQSSWRGLCWVENMWSCMLLCSVYWIYAFEEQTNRYRKLLKPGKHIEMFTVKELHNTHCSTFQQAFISAIMVLFIKVSSLYMLYWDFVVRIS